MKISDRALKTPPSPIRKLVPYAERAKKKGIHIYNLNIGQPDIKSPSAFLRAVNTYSSTTVAYENSLGNSQLRQDLVKYYRKNDIDATTDNIIITTGGSEAILFALLATCDPSDECLVFEPFYANYAGFASMAGVNLKAVTTKPQDGFHLPTRSEVERQITSKTKAIVIVSPNNPTGTVLSKSELETIGKIANQHNLFIISDETYREFIYDNLTHVSAWSLKANQNHVIIVDSLSKRYSLCGARIGCLVTKNKLVLDGVTKFAQARLASPTIEQVAAIAALKTPVSYFNKIKDEYQNRRNTLIEGLQAIPGVYVQKPSGAFYCIAKLPVKNAEEYATWLLTDYQQDRKTVMLAPAAGFYLSNKLGADEVRIAYVLNQSDLKQAIQILHDSLAVYKNTVGSK